MAEHRPLVLVQGELSELPVGDTITGSQSEEDVAYGKQVDFVSDNLLYRGESVPGTATSASSWRIRKITIGNDGDVSELWADGNADFDNVWDDRETLSYS